MPTVRYTSDGGSYRDNEGNRADPDDPLLEVDDAKAETLVDQFRFEYVDDEAGSCDTVKDDGEVCGRNLPCPYHTDEED